MRSIYLSVFWPIVFTVVMWIAHYYRVEISDFKVLGVVPRTQKGLLGIIFSPFIHGSWKHLISNTFPFLILGTALFMFYKELAFKVLFWIYIGGGLWLWSFGRHANHIGASGVVYGLFAFLAFSGMVRQHKPLIALSLLVIFVYGSMIWGVFPLDVKISWEGHLSGLAWGVLLSFFFKHKGPSVVKVPLDEDDSRNEMLYGKDYWRGEIFHEGHRRKQAANQENQVSNNGVEDAVILDENYTGPYFSNSTDIFKVVYKSTDTSSSNSTDANSETK